MSESAARWLDRHGYGDSAVHRLDGRAKLLATAVFVGSVTSFSKYEVAGLMPYFTLPVALALVGRVPARPLLRLLAAASPFALLVGAWNPLLDRAPRAALLGATVAGGWLSFLSILLRFSLCALAVLVLVGTTPLPKLLRALRQLGLPRAFVTQIQLLYRYLFLMVDEGQRLSQARLLRQPARRLPPVAIAKRMLATLFWRTWERGERIYLCMKARGFEGELPLSTLPRFRPSDALFLAGVLLASIGARFLPISRWLGASLLGGGRT